MEHARDFSAPRPNADRLGRPLYSPCPDAEELADVLELDDHTLSADKARTLLRKLRDLNLCAGPVAVSRQLQIVLNGCLSLDGPVESGVRYRLRHADGSDGWLAMHWEPNGLQLSASGLAPHRNLCVRLTCDRQGRVCARELAGRVSPESTDRRELEHFLRRIVRTLFRS